MYIYRSEWYKEDIGHERDLCEKTREDEEEEVEEEEGAGGESRLLVVFGGERIVDVLVVVGGVGREERGGDAKKDGSRDAKVVVVDVGFVVEGSVEGVREEECVGGSCQVSSESLSSSFTVWKSIPRSNQS